MNSAGFESDSFQIRTADSTCRLLFCNSSKIRNKSKSANKLNNFLNSYSTRIIYTLVL